MPSLQSGGPLVTRVVSMSSVPHVETAHAVSSGWAELALGVGGHSAPF